MVGIYIEPEKTKGGLILSTGAIKESVWQGTVGLVLKKRKTAFNDEPETGTYFHGYDVNVGNWVVFRSGDARASGSMAWIAAWSRTRCSTWWSTTVT
ncbi:MULTISPECIES: hypothetical protein [Bradyrhizobium]|uniref:Uncharacterized protein n=2 Tax=Nitrobacteraceae TaxID=41294 RepID=A0A0R3MNN0_9BRAD|nr:hypothetical protein [Bradyrhizobium retamae]KRR19213.1 hypothetical protein CQ13_34185 [Bradyrhizobium retamae]